MKNVIIGAIALIFGSKLLEIAITQQYWDLTIPSYVFIGIGIFILAREYIRNQKVLEKDSLQQNDKNDSV